MTKLLPRWAWTFLVSMCLAPSASAADKAKDLICEKIVPGTFWDSEKDGCYKCPKGFKHNDRATYSFGACTKREERDGDYQLRDGKKQSGPICTEGAWVSLHDPKNWPAGVCMKCPKPPADVYAPGGKGDRIRWSRGDGRYEHDHSKKGTEEGVCWRDVLAVPDVYAVNVVGGRLLKLCEATLTVFAPGKAFPSPVSLASKVMPSGVTKDELHDAVEKFKKGLSKKDQVALDKVGALAKLFTAAASKDLFDTDGLCDSGTVLAKLKKLGLVPKDWSNKHYVAFSTVFDAGLGAGALGGYMLVTNFDNVTKTVGLLGAQLGVKGGIGATGGVQFFPNIDDFDDFLGRGLGASVGVDVFAIGVGVDASFTFSKKGAVELQGIGPNLSLGISGTPASIGVSGTYSWDMSKVKNY